MRLLRPRPWPVGQPARHAGLSVLAGGTLRHDDRTDIFLSAVASPCPIVPDGGGHGLREACGRPDSRPCAAARPRDGGDVECRGVDVAGPKLRSGAIAGRGGGAAANCGVVHPGNHEHARRRQRCVQPNFLFRLQSGQSSVGILFSRYTRSGDHERAEHRRRRSEIRQHQFAWWDVCRSAMG